MGDETAQFALRFSEAVRFLATFASDDGRAEPAAVRRALAAIEAVYGTETGAVRDWADQRRKVMAQLAPLREALDSSGVNDEVRRMARTLVQLCSGR